MSRPLYDETDYELLGGTSLRVVFDEDTEQVVDLELVLYGEMYGPLRDEDFFCQVRLDPEVKTLVRPNGADFNPYVLHEWLRVYDDLARRLRAAESRVGHSPHSQFISKRS